MHSSWNQWNSSVPSAVGYGANYQQPAPQPSTFSQPVNPYPSTNPVTTPAVNSQYQTPLYGQPQQQQQQQQQWQQWEQWQQQYAQWHQQYGDKYQGPLPTGMLPTGMPNAYSSIPPLPTSAPTAQPPPPDSIPPTSDKVEESGKRSHEGGKEETKKQKTGKGSKAETVEDLIEQEKTFDEQFKSWEASFLKWKDQNSNHPDKAQYKEYEAKWESWREQLLQKREQLRKKRETKEAEAAAAAAAAKEAALATSSNPTSVPGYSTAPAVPNNPYVPPNMMYPMSYPGQDMNQMGQQPPNYMSNFPMFNMPPPSNVPHQMSMMPPTGSTDTQNVGQNLDGSKNNQSLEFLSSSANNTKSIPGLDLVGSERNPNSLASSIPPSSALFSYNQDVTKPLHTSDDKPFNFPVPPQSNNYNYNNSHNQYSFSLNRPPPPLSNNQYQKNNYYDQKKDYAERRPYDDKFGRPNKFESDYNYRSASDPNYQRNDLSLDRYNSKPPVFTPNFNSEKYAKYLEDEYDDSRFRDPEPAESPKYNNKFGNYNRDEKNFSNFRQNYGNKDNRNFANNKFDDYKKDFNDINRKEIGRGFGRAKPPFDRNKPDQRFGGRPPFGRGVPSDGIRLSFNSWPNDPQGPIEKLENADGDKSDGKPMSLLDIPFIKPPDMFDKKPFNDKPQFADKTESGVLAPQDEPFPQFLDKKSRSFASNDLSFPSLKSHISPATKEEDVDKSAELNVGPPVLEVLVPVHFFEYDHIKKTSAEAIPESFEPIFIFDYSHGKKKTTNDFIQSLVAEVKDKDDAWEGEPWDENKKTNDGVNPLPQRNRGGDDLTKELAAILNKSDSDKPKDVKKDNLDDSRSFSEKKKNDIWPCEVADEEQNDNVNVPVVPQSKLIDDLLVPPGRISRPGKLVIIMRGPPGSGKTYTAKLIKDKEVEMGGSVPRILSLDDYFTVENDVEETDPNTGKKTMKKAMEYEYDPALEPSYQESLVKSFKKTVGDGFFPFIIVDCINDKLKKFEEMCTFAKTKGFQVYICEMDMDLSTCSKRNVHNRTEEDIQKLIDGWEKTPGTQTVLDVRSLLQSAAITEVDMTDVVEEQKDEAKIESEPEKMEETEAKKEVIEESPVDESKEGFSSYMELCTSKWEKMENTEEKLDRLDGVSKKRTSTTFKEWLQLPENEADLSWYASNDKTTESTVSRKKRVRWADLEERVAQQKMRKIGFVVGQTDWNRMMDPSFGGSALTQTKYIYK